MHFVRVSVYLYAFVWECMGLCGNAWAELGLGLGGLYGNAWAGLGLGLGPCIPIQTHTNT